MSEHEPPRPDDPAVDPVGEPSAPAPPAWDPGPPHPIQLIVTDDLKRSRLTVLLRLFLLIPHAIWVSIWGIGVFFAVVAAWFAALFTGRVPDGLHRFIAQYARYSTHVSAYAMIAANPFPGFMGTTAYPIDLQIPGPVEQSRLTVFFRAILVIPIWIVLSLLQYVIWIPVVIAWFAGVIVGRTPQWAENMMLFYLRLNARAYAYVGLLTPKYPSFD